MPTYGGGGFNKGLFMGDKFKELVSGFFRVPDKPCMVKTINHH